MTKLVANPRRHPSDSTSLLNQKMAYTSITGNPSRTSRVTGPLRRGGLLSGGGSITAPEGTIFDPQFGPALSPDGKHIAFIASSKGSRTLWIRDLDSTTPRMIRGSEEAIYPFWSPDSRSVAFLVAGGAIKRSDISEGNSSAVPLAVKK